MEGRWRVVGEGDRKVEQRSLGIWIEFVRYLKDVGSIVLQYLWCSHVDLDMSHLSWQAEYPMGTVRRCPKNIGDRKSMLLLAFFVFDYCRAIVCLRMHQNCRIAFLKQNCNANVSCYQGRLVHP